MCWETSLKECQIKRIAVNDIQVYKILKERRTWISNRVKYVSPYYNFKYKLNKIYKSRLELDQIRDDTLIIENGLHSFTSLQRTEYYRDTCEPYCETWIIFKAIIPKGSVYYKNGAGEIVSNKLKIVEICS